MSSAVRIYHNPSCSKCRLSMQLLEDNGVIPDVVEYLKQPPDAEELKAILDLLALEPRDLMRKHEAPYRDLQLDDDTLGREALIHAMVANPVLIERPIVIHGKRAVIGRPPEKILDIL